MDDKAKDIIIYELSTVNGVFHAGGRYYNDEICEYVTKYGSYEVLKGDKLYFESLSKIFDWIVENAGKIIPEIRTIEYIGDYKGLTDVIKITNLSKGDISYYTAVNKKEFLIYYEGNNYWKISTNGYPIKYINNLKYIYNLFEERGVTLKNNVFKTGKERIEYKKTKHRNYYGIINVEYFSQTEENKQKIKKYHHYV